MNRPFGGGSSFCDPVRTALLFRSYTERREPLKTMVGGFLPFAEAAGSHLERLVLRDGLIEKVDDLTDEQAQLCSLRNLC